jgi:hypothetical protein
MIQKFIHSLSTPKLGSEYTEEALERPLPAPVGVNCPDHPTYPLVWHGDYGWCRRGQHLVPLTISPDEQYVWTGSGDWQPISKEH